MPVCEPGRARALYSATDARMGKRMDVVSHGLKEALTAVLDRQTLPGSIAKATVADVLRMLHRAMIRSERDQIEMLKTACSLFGSRATAHLACIVGAECAIPDTPHSDDDHRRELEFSALCAGRGIETTEGRRIFQEFLAAFVERTPNYSEFQLSPCIAVYWSVGPEAAFHLCGLHEGDGLNMAVTELFGYFDRSLGRFNKLVELWQLELEFERESER